MMLFGQIPALEDGSLRLYGMHLLAVTRLCSHSSLAIVQLAAETRAIARYLSSKYRDQGNDLLPAVDDVQGWALFEKFASVEYSQVFDAALQVLCLKFFNP